MADEIETPIERLVKRWGGNVRERRDELGLSQTALAQRSPMFTTQATVSAYELGLRPFTPAIMLAFALALESTVVKLFPWPEYIEQMEKLRLGGWRPAATGEAPAA